ncbi:tetratricopeptide repeat protein [Sinomonas humi]|uniref:Uncharacterized protein n=1 Tax=Sinomonas humi TaxID=1338436 RepID=A0A0B2ARL4_9MICC|nr:tetratricopeptide repeat protein [Sinomonas humi]KHL04498.1 hypothetical protein LK10_05010 [Sinomonas humi]
MEDDPSDRLQRLLDSLADSIMAPEQIRGELRTIIQVLRAVPDTPEGAAVLRLAADVHEGIGDLFEMAGRWAEARTEYGAALDLYTQLGLPADQATVRRNLGIVHQEAGRLEEAAASSNSA